MGGGIAKPDQYVDRILKIVESKSPYKYKQYKRTMLFLDARKSVEKIDTSR